MISSLLLVAALLPAPLGFTEDAAPSQHPITAQTDKPAPQLVQLEQTLTQRQEAKANGLLTPERYQDFLAKFRAMLDAVMTRVPPTPENKGLHAQIIARLGEKERGQALAGLSKVLEENPKSPPLLRAKGQILYEQKDYPAAAESARQAWEYSNHSDIAALTLLKMSAGRVAPVAAAGVSPRALPKPQSASAASPDDPSKPYKLAIKSSAKPLGVPALADVPKSKELPPPRPYWPWPAGGVLSVLGTAWGVKKKLDDERLTGPIAMAGLGLSLLGASLMFPPASPALVTAGGPALTVGTASLGQAATGTLGSILTTVGVKSGFEELISRAKSNQQEGSNNSTVDRPSDRSSNANAKDSLTKKLDALERAQKTAAEKRILPDGRVRYYSSEKLARTPGPTRGASYVTEYNPKTGDVRQWMESYDHSGNVVRVHPKMINGAMVDAPHFPSTGSELVP